MPETWPEAVRPELIKEALARIAGGESLRAVCRSEIMPSPQTMLRWIEDAGLTEQYARAMEQRADAVFDELFEIADSTSEDVNRDRLRVDTRKWALARMSPKKYGEKLDLNHSGGLKVEGIEVTFVRPEAPASDA